MLGFLLLVAVLIAADVYFETHFPKVETVTLQSDKLQPGQSLKILQISDVHSKVFGNNNEDFLQMIRDQNADIIALTGDLLDDSAPDIRPMWQFAEELKKINPQVYYISGNHEWRRHDREMFWAGLEERGILMLNNANTQIQKDDLVWNLVGVDDPSTWHDDVETAFQGVDSQKNYTVLLAHAPDLIFRNKDLPADLMLSGHTHGGQIRLPFVGAIAVPGQRLFPAYDKGIFELENSTTLYLDSGVGTSIWPIRFLNRSQITLITIKGA